jgi:hypothetical protein
VTDLLGYRHKNGLNSTDTRDDMLKNYSMNELLTGIEMASALKRVCDVKAVENIK